MKKLAKQDIKLLIDLFKMTDIELHNFLYKKLKNIYGKDKIVRKEGKYLVAVGSKIGLVAHLDVFGTTPPKEIVYNKEYITAIDNVLGADDRTGVFIILKILKLGFKPTIIFTHDEEIGCEGAKTFTEDFSDIGVKYLIQLDRRGNGVVFYNNDNQEFIQYILSFRDKEEFGSFSDISILCPQCNVSGCNLGVGYYNEHTKGEYQNIQELEEAIKVTMQLLQDEDNAKVYEYQELEYVNSLDTELDESKVFYQGEWITLREYYLMEEYGLTVKELKEDETIGDIYLEEEQTSEDFPF